MKRTRTVILLTLLVAGTGIGTVSAQEADLERLLSVSSGLSADDPTAITSWTRGAQLHRVLGYATMAGVATTGLLGWLYPGELHGAAALGTTGLAVASTAVGINTYIRDRSIPLGHVALTSLGTLGFIANMMIEPGESDEGGDGNVQLHRWVGTGASAAFALGVAWVIAY